MGGRMVAADRGPRAARPITRPEVRGASSGRSARPAGRWPAAAGQPRQEPGEQRRAVGVADVDDDVAGRRARDGELARNAGGGEPRQRRVLEVQERADPRSRSRSSGRTDRRRRSRRRSCDRARSAAARRSPAIAPVPLEDSAAAGRRRSTGGSGRRRRARSRRQRSGRGRSVSRGVRSTRPSPSRRRTSDSSSAS